MKKQFPVIMTAVIAVAAVLIAAILLVSYVTDKPTGPVIEATYESGDHPGQTMPEMTEFSPYEEPSSSFEQTEILVPDPSEATTLLPSEALTDPSLAETTLPPESGETTVAQVVTQVVQATNEAFSKVFAIPRTPRYNPPDTDIDFDSASLASYMYDPDGNYYYTNDKDCWQYNFGFNEGYDSMAPVTMMFYDTVRTKFVYDNKEYLVQMWKGQYGYAFVGGEIGVYTRPVGSSGTHYNCARQDDWLNMEMCFMWDEYSNGEYKAVFKRPYGKYWWCTGFVVGFDGQTNRHQFRLVAHITFESTEMADAFCKAFEANGFKRAESVNSSTLDSFVQVGPDVGFTWQNITQ